MAMERGSGVGLWTFDAEGNAVGEGRPRRKRRARSAKKRPTARGMRMVRALRGGTSMGQAAQQVKV